jgi:hypothetical protein
MMASFAQNCTIACILQASEGKDLLQPVKPVVLVDYQFQVTLKLARLIAFVDKCKLGLIP